MVLRRQLGAHTVELDAEDGFARYWLKEPRRLEFSEMLEAAADASYTITRIQMEIEGETSQEDCEACGKVVTIFTLDKTGQKFELTQKHQSGMHLRSMAEASDWESDHPRLTLERKP